jgi:hypothetical protein
MKAGIQRFRVQYLETLEIWTIKTKHSNKREQDFMVNNYKFFEDSNEKRKIELISRQLRDRASNELRWNK